MEGGLQLAAGYLATTYGRIQSHHIGVREFRDRASHCLSEGETLAIEKHGEMIGYYLPVKRSAEAGRKAREAFEAKLEAFLDGTGPSEDELADSLTVELGAGR